MCAVATREYAQAGVDYNKIAPFKRAMQGVCQRTAANAGKRGVKILGGRARGTFQFTQQPFAQHSVTEGLGNKNVIAEWMYANARHVQDLRLGRSFHRGIMWDTAMMAIMDALASGAVPVVYTDEVAAGNDNWFTDEVRSADCAAGLEELCNLVSMSLIGGETPALKYLVKEYPVFSGNVLAIIRKQWHYIDGSQLRAGDRILGAASEGAMCNGYSLLLKRAETLPDHFLTKLPDGRTFGQHALDWTPSYVKLVEALQDRGVEIHALQPATGSGLSKIAADKRDFTYKVEEWPAEIPMIFEFMRELGVSEYDLHTTFNMGIGYYIFVPPRHVDFVMEVGNLVGCPISYIGSVEAGRREVHIPSKHLVLPPPEE